MAYYFGKRVIVSDLDGLVEFVDIGVTGDIFDSIEELEKLLLIYDNIDSTRNSNVLEYYANNLDWKSGIHRCLTDMV